MLIDEEGQKDDVCWRNDLSGKISVTPVYNIIHDHAGSEDDSTWDNI